MLQQLEFKNVTGRRHKQSLIRSYGTPNGTGRCCVAQCYKIIGAAIKITWANIANAVLDFGTKNIIRSPF